MIRFHEQHLELGLKNTEMKTHSAIWFLDILMQLPEKKMIKKKKKPTKQQGSNCDRIAEVQITEARFFLCPPSRPK